MEEDKQRLVTFLYDVRDYLGRVVESESFFSDDVYSEVVELWNQAKELRLIENVQDVLRGAATDPDGPANIDQRLERVGLTGRMLNIKLGIFDRLRKRIWNPKNVRKALGIMNAILGSLTAAIPMTEPLAEVKDIIERLIEDEDETT